MNETWPAKNFPQSLMDNALGHAGGIATMAWYAADYLEKIESALNGDDEDSDKGDDAESIRGDFEMVSNLAEHIKNYSETLEKLISELQEKVLTQG